MLFNCCESCSKFAICICRCEDPPRFFCDLHATNHIKSSGDHSIQAALESLSASEVSSLRDSYNTYRLSSLQQAVQTRNSRIESLLIKIRIAEEECSSIIKTILGGQIAKDIEQVLLYRALPLFSDSSVVRSLLDLKHAPDFSDFSSPPTLQTLASLDSSLKASFLSSFPSYLSSSTQTNHNYTSSSAQTHPSSTVSVQTSSKPSFSAQHFRSQIDISKQIELPDPKNYRWKLLKKKKAHKYPIYSIAVSDCERYIASASEDKTIKIWSLQTLALFRTLKGHTDSVLSVAFLGNTVVSGSRDNTIKIWEEDRCVNTLKKHSDPVTSVCVSSCKRLIVSGSVDKTAVVFRLQDNPTLHTLKHSDVVLSVAFSPNNKEIVTGSRDGKMRIWNTETGQLLKTLNAHSDRVTCVVFSGKFIASSSRDRTVKIWDRDNDRALLTFTGHSSSVCAVDVRDNVVASLGQDNRIIIRDIRSGSVIQTLQPNKQADLYQVGLKVLERGKFMVSGALDGSLNVWRRLS